MKTAFKLAYRNLIGAGLRTWLNVGILSFTFIIIIFFNGLMDGWNNQAKKDSIEWQFGYGQLVNNEYDPFDPFTILDGHGKLSKEKSKGLTPVLVRQASVFPDGRMVSMLLKGIDVNQDIVKIPVEKLKASKANIPAIIGERMATSLKLKIGDEILMRWRDKNGTFDATNITIVDVFKTTVPAIDAGQVWISLDKLWEITGMEDQATLFIAHKNYKQSKAEGWNFKGQDELLQDITDLIATKKGSTSILYIMLLAISLLAIFDTQVLSIFRRQREIGTYISLGMTRRQVIQLFTIEGSLYSILAAIFGSILAFPLMIWLSKEGIKMTTATDDMGIVIGDAIYPAYSLALFGSTILLVVISATIVSYLPTRKIAKMNPVDALKGKLQ